MEKQRAEFFDKELWFKVKIHRWTFAVIVLLSCLIAGSVISFQYRDLIMDYIYKDRAGKAINSSNSKILNAQNLGISETILEQHQKKLEDAQRLYGASEYSRAFYVADSCLNDLLKLINEHLNPGKNTTYATFTFVNGKVEILEPGSKRWVRAREGVQVPPRTKVQTYQNSKAEIIFKKNRLTLSEGSYITLDLRERKDRKRPSWMEIKVEKEGAHFEANVRVEKEGDIFTVKQDDAKLLVRNDAELEYKGDKEGIDISNYKSVQPLQFSTKNTTVEFSTNEALTLPHGKENPIIEKLIFAPELLQPPNVSLVPFRPGKPLDMLLRWTKASRAKEYLIEVSNNTRFQNLYGESRVKRLSYNLENLSEGTYFWRVASLSSERRSSFTPFWSFRVIPWDESASLIPETKPPKLQVDDIRQKGYLVIIKGKTVPGGILLINDKKQTVENDGTFTAFCSISETFTLDVFDQDGRQTSITKHFKISQ